MNAEIYYDKVVSLFSSCNMKENFGSRETMEVVTEKYS